MILRGASFVAAKLLALSRTAWYLISSNYFAKRVDVHAKAKPRATGGRKVTGLLNGKTAGLP
jgi:hypothetical protein